MVKVNDRGQTPAGYSSANIHLNQEYFLHAPQSGQTYYPYTPYTYPHPLTIDTDQTSISCKRPVLPRETPCAQHAPETMNSSIFSINGEKIPNTIAYKKIKHGVYIIMDNDRLKARKVQFVE